MNRPAPRVRLVDSSRGEVRVETGVGRIVRIEPPAHDASPYVEFVIKAAPLVDYVTGWADRRVAPFTDLLRNGRGAFAASSIDVDYAYRVEVHRQFGVDPSVPLSALGPAMKRRRLVNLAASVDVPAELDVDVLDAPDPIGDCLRMGFAHMSPSPAPASVTPPRPAPDWVPFAALLEYSRHNLEGHAATYGVPGLAAQDQLAADARQWLVEAGVDVADEHVLRAVFAGVALTHHCATKVGPDGNLTPVAVRQALCALVLNLPADAAASGSESAA